MARNYSDIENDKKIIAMSDEEIIKDKASYLLYLDKMDMIEYLTNEERGQLITAIHYNRSNAYRGTEYPEPDFSNNPKLDLVYKQILLPFAKLDKNYAATARGKANSRLAKEEKTKKDEDAAKKRTKKEEAATKSETASVSEKKDNNMEFSKEENKNTSVNNMAENAEVKTLAYFTRKIANANTEEQLKAIDKEIDNCGTLTNMEQYQLATQIDNRSTALRWHNNDDEDDELELPFPEAELMDVPFDESEFKESNNE